MNFSTHFTLDEMIRSELAARHGIDNTPGGEEVANLQALCTMTLDPLREYLNIPITVTSGYRSQRINGLIGGAPTSQHTKGQAADIVTKLAPKDLFNAIINATTLILFDQLILEFNQWVHISYVSDTPNRRDILVAELFNGKTVYKKYDA